MTGTKAQAGPNGTVTMLAARIRAFGQPLEEERVPRPEPGLGEALVRIQACAIGAGEIQVFKRVRAAYDTAAAPFWLPHTIGFRGAGLVEATAPDVTGWRPGDRVVINGFMGCGACRECRTGQENFCPQHRLLGLDPGFPGAMAEFVRVPASRLHRVSAAVPMNRAPMLGDVALMLRAWGRAAPPPGSSIVIFGCGLVGSAAVHVAGLYSPRLLIGVDIVPNRLELAKSLGAHAVVDGSHADAVAEIRRLTEGGADVTMDAVGDESTIVPAIQATRPQGITLLLGVYKPVTLTLDNYYGDVVYKEAALLACFGKTNRDFARAVGLAEAGLVDLSRFPVREFRLGEANQALEFAMSGAFPGRVVLTPDPS